MHLQNEKTAIVLFYILNKNLFNASDLIFTGKCHMLLFLEQEIL